MTTSTSVHKFSGFIPTSPLSSSEEDSHVSDLHLGIHHLVLDLNLSSSPPNFSSSPPKELPKARRTSIQRKPDLSQITEVEDENAENSPVITHPSSVDTLEVTWNTKQIVLIKQGVIGRGKTSVVYQIAIHGQDPEEKWALKISENPDQKEHRHNQKTFLKEYRIHREIREGTVDEPIGIQSKVDRIYYHNSETNNNIALVSRRYDGDVVSFQKKYHFNPQFPRQIIDLFCQITEGHLLLHSKNYYHLDGQNPENNFYLKQGEDVTGCLGDLAGCFQFHGSFEKNAKEKTNHTPIYSCYDDLYAIAQAKNDPSEADYTKKELSLKEHAEAHIVFGMATAIYALVLNYYPFPKTTLGKYPTPKRIDPENESIKALNIKGLSVEFTSFLAKMLDPVSSQRPKLFEVKQMLREEQKLLMTQEP